MNTQINEAIPHQPEADTFDLRKSWEYMRNAAIGHKLMILLSSMLTVSIMLAYIIIWPKVYATEVIIIADSEDDRQRTEFYNQWNLFRNNNLRDEVSLISTRAVLVNTIDELGLTYDDVYHPFLSYAAHLWGESLVGRNYRKLKYMILGRACDPNCPSEAEQLRGKTVRDFGLGVSMIPQTESYVGKVAVRASTPRVAEIANTLVEKYLEERKLRYIREAQTSLDSLHEETEKARVELTETEKLKEAFYTKENILLEFEKDKVEVGKWLELKSLIIEAEALRATLEENILEVEHQLEQEQSHVISARVYKQNSRKVILQDQRVQLQFGLKQTELVYTPDAPEVRDIKKQIAAVTEMIKNQEEMEESQFNEALSETYESLRQNRGRLLSQLAGVNAGLAIRKAAETEMRERVGKIPSKMKITREMGREHSIQETKYLSLQNKLTIAAVSLATISSAPSSIKVVDWAVPVDKASWPKTKMFLLLALVMGAVVGFLLGLFLDLIFQRVNRFSLTPQHIGDALFATVRKDPNRLCQVFSLQPQPKPSLLMKLTR